MTFDRVDGLRQCWECSISGTPLKTQIAKIHLKNTANYKSRTANYKKTNQLPTKEGTTQ
jgi:hypothetical protein